MYHTIFHWHNVFSLSRLVLYLCPYLRRHTPPGVTRLLCSRFFDFLPPLPRPILCRPLSHIARVPCTRSVTPTVSPTFHPPTSTVSVSPCLPGLVCPGSSGYLSTLKMSSLYLSVPSQTCNLMVPDWVLKLPRKTTPWLFTDVSPFQSLCPSRRPPMVSWGPLSTVHYHRTCLYHRHLHLSSRL